MKTYTLYEYKKLLYDNGLLERESVTPDDRPVTGLSYDSRKVFPGSIFICKGAAFRPEYLKSAVSSGAIAYISERRYPVDAECLPVSDVREAMACAAKLFYNTDKPLPKIIGITGTKGKTTTAFILKQIFDIYNAMQGRPECAIISSLITYDGSDRYDSLLTTPESVEIRRHIMNAAEGSLPQLILEVSSQALKYGRTDGTDFDMACFLNIGEDHIGPVEHSDFEDYFSSKLEIFSKAPLAFVFSGCAQLDRIEQRARECGCEVSLFGFREGDGVFSRDVTRLDGDGSDFTVVSGGQHSDYTLALSGEYNIANALAAVAVAKRLDIPDSAIKKALQSVKVPGRDMKISSEDTRVTAVIDYAHNELSLEALLLSTRRIYPDRRIITVFGCPGGKAVNRRRGMAEVASRYSDFVIVTEDDPGNESPQEICDCLAHFIEQAGKKAGYEVVIPRPDAIKRAFELSGSGAVILLCGKGAEKKQKRAGFDEHYEGDEHYARLAMREYDAAVSGERHVDTVTV